MFYKTEQQCYFIKQMEETLGGRTSCLFSIDQINDMAKRYINGETDLAETLLKSQYKLIYKTVGNFINRHCIKNEQVCFDDLISEGFLSAMENIHKYNPDKISFPSFIQTYVTYHLLNIVKTLGRVVKIPVSEIKKTIAHRNNQNDLYKLQQRENILESPTTYNYAIVKGKDNTITYGQIKDFNIVDISEMPLERLGVIDDAEMQIEDEFEQKIKKCLEDWEWDLYFYREKKGLKFEDCASLIRPKNPEYLKNLKDNALNRIKITTETNGNLSHKILEKYVIKRVLNLIFNRAFPTISICNKSKLQLKVSSDIKIIGVELNGEIIKPIQEGNMLIINLDWGKCYSVSELKKELKRIKNKMYYYYGKCKEMDCD